MKIRFSILFSLFLSSVFFAQTDELNLQKYWKFRNDFVQKFVKIGPNQGESLPAGSIGPVDCLDNTTHDGFEYYGKMHWGDGMIRQGHYLVMLSTEYALKKKYGMETRGTLNELYYALNAINRLDYRAEEDLGKFVYNTEFSPDTNGFFLREDVPEDFCLNWQDTRLKPRCTNSAYYQNNNTEKIHDPSRYLFTDSSTSYQNVPSLDQLTGLIIGLSAVHQFVDDIYVQPYSDDRGFKIIEETKAITERLIGYAANHNWFLIDVNGWPVANGGGDLIIAAYPLLKAAERILEVDIREKFNLRAKRRFQNGYGTVQHCLTGYGVSGGPDRQEWACDQIKLFDLGELRMRYALKPGAKPGKWNNQTISTFQDWEDDAKLSVNVLRMKRMWLKTIPEFYPTMYNDWLDDHRIALLMWPFNQLGFHQVNLTDYNNTIYYNLGVASGEWNQEQSHVWGNVTENRQLELLNALVRGEQPKESQAFYKAYLDSMPSSGPYHLWQNWPDDDQGKDSLFQSGGWASEYRWTHPEESYGLRGRKGIFSGLDYLAYHNLYYLTFADSLPDFTESYGCFCEDAPQLPNPRSSNQARTRRLDILNLKLAQIPSHVPNVFDRSFNVVRGKFEIRPYFREYIDYQIKTASFQTRNAIIAPGAVVSVRTNFVICNNSTLGVQDRAVIRIQTGDVTVQPGSRLQLKGEVNIAPRRQLVIKPSAELNLSENATIELSEDASLVIEKGAIRVDYLEGENRVTTSDQLEIKGPKRISSKELKSYFSVE